jgi:perosamine synthetase
MKTSDPKILSYGKQSLGEEEIREVVEVLKSSWISQGPKIDEFERAFADYCGAKYAVAVSNGTAALHLAYIAAGLKPGTEGITTPITFLATANAMVMTGAKPVFADIQYETVNIDPAQIQKKITNKTKVIAPVHFGGLPVDLAEIQKIAKKNKIMVVEDGCHALGAEYRGKKIGSCEYSDMTCFSFHPVKHITTGEGGMITTNYQKIYDRLKVLRTHGMIKDEATKKIGPWYVRQEELGFNYRITDFQCALGIVQLKKLDAFVRRRIEIAEQYDAGFKSLGDWVRLPQVQHKDRIHSWHLYLLRLHKAKITRKDLFERLWNSGIRLQVHYIPVHTQPFYQKTFKTKKGAFPLSEKYFQETISLPMHVELDDADVRRVIETVKESLKP